jgi:hypothetical protein
VKGGNAADDYEDAAHPHDATREATRSFRCAVADGATEASFSGLWARILVEAFCAGRLRDSHFGEDVAGLSQEWGERVGTRSLPWYAEQKLESGAFAAIVGLTVGADGTWRAFAVGDTCLLHVRNGHLQTSVPLDRSDAFSNAPRLVGTVATANRGVVPLRFWGRWEPGDELYLMTDAIAAWALGRVEEGRPPWRTLDSLMRGPYVRFGRWVALQRERGTLRNDDVTVQRLLLV